MTPSSGAHIKRPSNSPESQSFVPALSRVRQKSKALLPDSNMFFFCLVSGINRDLKLHPDYSAVKKSSAEGMQFVPNILFSMKALDLSEHLYFIVM